MLRDQLTHRVSSAVEALITAGSLPEAVRSVAIEISDTKTADHGDYACNFALVATKLAGMPPRAIAEILANELEGAPFAAIEIAGPGFLNFRVQPGEITKFVDEILTLGVGFALKPAATGKKINVEFVSVNPNGPITVGSGRGAAFGSTLCNVLEAAGNEVHREYYINDGVNSEQMRLFTESVVAILENRPIPEGGYKGDYVVELANSIEPVGSWPTLAEQTVEWIDNQIARAESDLATAEPEDLKPLRDSIEVYTMARGFVQSANSVVDYLRSGGPVTADLTFSALRRICQAQMLAKQREDLAAFGVTFDTWFSEQSLHDSGEVALRIEGLIKNGQADTEPFRTKLKLGKNGVIEEVIREEQANDEDDVDGAEPTLWLRSTQFGDDMDRVLRRRDGRLTYIASDVAYHRDKFNRPPNADKLITILGPDHHGYIGRLQAVLAALLASENSIPDDEALMVAKARLEVIIFQIVRFVKEGKPAPMRKRDGNIYALIDLITELGKNIEPDSDPAKQREVGRDVARFFYLMRSHDTHMDFDIDLATKQSDENPVFYVQYAHARIGSVLMKASEAGFTGERPDLSLLVHERELALVKKVLDLPFEIDRAARDYGVHRLTTYSAELARTFHGFYDVCRVVQADQPDLSNARVALCHMARIGLRATLNILGISAPDVMRRAETVV